MVEQNFKDEPWLEQQWKDGKLMCFRIARNVLANHSSSSHQQT